MTQILATSKQGINVLTATNPNDFLFHSQYNSLKIVATGVFSQAVPATTDAEYSFAHNLSYTPLVEGFCTVDAHGYACAPYEGIDIANFPYFFYFYHIGADSTNIYVRLSNSDSSQQTFSIRYYIFEVP